MSFSPPPLTGIRALELAGLAPGPFCGILLADYGATVLRIDRPTPDAHTEDASPTHDRLTRHKSSIALSLKSPAGIALLKSLVANVDVLIDPFRPGVLERLGLGPKDVLLKINPRLIVARMTGYRRDGKYKDMAGHDINYIAVSGVLSMLGRVDQKPYPPGNIVGDFAGGGAVCFMGILLALFARERSGRGQVVEANMVDGSAYLASFPRLMMKTPMWHKPRGENVLDGGAPFYDTYETKDGKHMSVGAIEPQFYAELLKGLELKEDEVPDRSDDEDWDKLRGVFTQRFKEKTRAEWEKVFDGTDACCAPVLEQSELEESKYDQRPMVTLSDTPGLRITESKDGEDEDIKASRGQGAGVEGEGWITDGLAPGAGGEAVLEQWMGWKKERQFKVVDGGLEKIDESKL